MSKLYFYSKSADKYPGYGTNEYTNNTVKHNELSKIKDWRKILSNFYVSQFKFNGYTWNTAEHAFQSSKINLVNKTKVYTFTVDSKTKLGTGDGLAARKKRKLVLLNKTDLQKWENIKLSTLTKILCAKFTQIKIANRVLKLTKNSELWHGARGIPSTRQLHLEKIRSSL